MKSAISHKESLPSQRTVKRRRTERIAEAIDDRKESNQSVEAKQNELLPGVDKKIDETYSSSSSETENDDDLELELQRLQQLRETKARKNSIGMPQSTNWNYDVLFQSKSRRESNVQDIRNDKQESVAYKSFMKKMFK